jgi:acyl carrier protein
VLGHRAKKEEVAMPADPIATADAIGARIRDYIVTNFLENGSARLDDDVSLGASGILDSFSVMMLANFVEEEFGVVIDLEVTPPHELQSVRSISSFVRRSMRADA